MRYFDLISSAVILPQRMILLVIVFWAFYVPAPDHMFCSTEQSQSLSCGAVLNFNFISVNLVHMSMRL